MPKRPNVLFVLSDQHYAKVMGCKGHAIARTPNMDRLAGQGVRFDNCISQNPICTPSRVCYLSGQYPHNTGYYGNEGPNPGGLPNMLGHFRRHGYVTAAVGKIHCPEYWVEDQSDFYREVYGDCSVGGAPEYEAHLRDKGLTEVRDDDMLRDLGVKGMQSHEGRQSNMPYEHTVEGWSVREAIGFMEQATGQGRPFFAHVSLPRPHQCYTPSEPFWSWYSDADIEMPPNVEYDMSLKAPHLRKRHEDERRGEWTAFEPRTWEAVSRGAQTRPLMGA